jgi:hypothetical protein
MPVRDDPGDEDQGAVEDDEGVPGLPGGALRGAASGAGGPAAQQYAGVDPLVWVALLGI